jgi:hypothetical protein
MLAAMAADTIAPGWQRDAAAVAEALFAADVGAPPAARIAWLVDDLEHFLETVGGRSRLVFRLALEVVTRAAPPLVLSLKRYADMPIASRVRALERLEKSPLSIMLFAVKTLLCFHWFEHPDSAAEAGLLPNVTALGRYRRPATRSPRPTTQR